MKTDFDFIVNRKNTGSLKWDKYTGTDILPMWVADMDFRAPRAVVEALHERIDHGIFGYTLPPSELVDHIVQRLAVQYSWHIEPTWIVWIPGLVSGLNIACRAVGTTGDEVLTMTPIYQPFLTAPQLSERVLVTVPLIDDGTAWRIDFDKFEQAIGTKTKLFLLCHPHNPVGRVFLKQELERIAEICAARNVVVCSDEIHCELILDQHLQHIPFAGLSGNMGYNVITLMAPSKTFNIPGLGCSFAIIPNPNLRRAFKRVMAGIVPEINTLGYAAALAAYRDSSSWHQDLLLYLRQNRDLVESTIQTLAGSLKMHHVEATYLAWLDARELQVTDPATFFEDAGVGLSDGSDFGSPGFLRLNFGCPRSILQIGLDRITDAVRKATG